MKKLYSLFVLGLTVVLLSACGSESSYDSNNEVPTAVAGVDQTVSEGQSVTLNGNSSEDTDGSIVSYTWKEGTELLSTDATFSYVFSAGTHTITLTVEDDKGATATDSVQITVEASLVATISAEQNALVNQLVHLVGSATPSDNITYSWNFDYQPRESNAVLSENNVSSPTFTPDVEGTYIFTLTVTDGIKTATDKVTILVQDTINRMLAYAGENQNVIVGEWVQLDGSGSSAGEADSINFSWSFVPNEIDESNVTIYTNKPEGSNATIYTNTSPRASFQADVAGNYLVELNVSDEANSSIWDIDQVLIIVSDPDTNTKPTAIIDEPQTNTDVRMGDLVNLIGHGIDATSETDGIPDNDELTYAWSILYKPAASQAIISQNTAQETFFSADVVGNYIISLTVNDGIQESDPASVLITAREQAAPIADAGGDKNGTVDTAILLDGSNSSDADGDNLTYSWSIINNPTGANASFVDSGATSSSLQKPEFITETSGQYVVELTVTDDSGYANNTSQPVNIVITINQNTAPIADAGDDATGTAGENILLDGTRSYDPDTADTTLTYFWDIIGFPADSNASFVIDANGTKTKTSTLARPQFQADIAGDYTLQLTVNDGHSENSTSAPDTVRITVDGDGGGGLLGL